MNALAQEAAEKIPEQLHGCDFVLSKKLAEAGDHKEPGHKWKLENGGTRFRVEDPRLQGHALSGGGLQVHLNAGLIAVDIDRPGLVDEVENALPCTFTVQSNRGRHLYYLAPDFVAHKAEGDGVEILGPGHLVSIPPTMHVEGTRYRVVNDVNVVRIGAEELRECLAPFGIESLAEKREREKRQAAEKSYRRKMAAIKRQLRKERPGSFEGRDAAEVLAEALQVLPDLLGFDREGPHPVHGIKKTGETDPEKVEKGNWFYDADGDRMNWYCLACKESGNIWDLAAQSLGIPGSDSCGEEWPSGRFPEIIEEVERWLQEGKI